ncbi:Pol, partial [Symbiodinium necroappetens]
MSDGSPDLDSGLVTPDMDLTPHDHQHGGAPANLGAVAPKGPPPPPGAFVDRDTPPADATMERASQAQRTDDRRAADGRATTEAAPGRGMVAPKARAEGDGADHSSTSSSPVASSDSDSPGNVSYSWSETSLFLEGHSFDEAVERLHTLYRQELQTRRVPGRSQAGCLAGLRRKTNRSNWYQVQAEARQRLTGQRLEEWSQFEYAATHEKRRDTSSRYDIQAATPRMIQAFPGPKSGTRGGPVAVMTAAGKQRGTARTTASASSASSSCFSRAGNMVPRQVQEAQRQAVSVSAKALAYPVLEHQWSRNSTDGYGKSAGLLFLLRRRVIWQTLENTVQAVPARHSLVVCGDFNSTLGHENPIAGPATTTCADHHDTDLRALMRRQSLTALNTWHCKNHHTYYATGSTSQIDFVMTRQRTAKHRAKYAAPLHSFPIGATRLNGHFPLHAQLPMHTFHQQPPSSHAQLVHNSSALQQAVRSHSPVAQELQQAVAARLPEVDTTHLLSAHDHVNRILLEETRRLFPPSAAPDNRVSAQPGYRVFAKHVWSLYSRLKHPGVCTFRNIFAKWLNLPKKPLHAETSEVCQDGALLSRDAELQAIVQHSNQTFAVHSDDTPLIPLNTDYGISDEALAAELSKLGLAKAVPKHIAPCAAWKLCATNIGAILGSALRGHLKQGTTARLDADWKDSYVVWIPKPNKPPVNVASLRPIGLTSPASKALAGSLRASLLSHLEPELKVLPQFAYSKHRGTADAIAKAHCHFHQVDLLLQQTKADRFQQQAGHRNRQRAGGLCISLDLSRAFDGVTRSHIYHEMQRQQVPQDLITLVQQLHKDAQYKFQVGDIRGSTVSTNGIKQGCVIAPYLWNYFTITFLSLLRQQRSLEWIQRVLSLFADDVWGAWLITCKSDLTSAIEDVALILATLENLHMTVNYSKTAILLKLTGKDASKLRRDHTFMKALAFLDQQAARMEAVLMKEAGMPACRLCGRQFFRMFIDRDHLLNEEAEIFAGYWDNQPDEYYLSETAPRSQKRHRPEQTPRWNLPPRRTSTHPSFTAHGPLRDPRAPPHYHQQDQLNLLSKVVLKQEEIISRLRHDKIFVLFMRNETNGTLGTLMKIAKDWRSKKNMEEAQLQSPLKTVLLASMLREVMNLAQQAVATEEAKAKHVQSEWLTSQGAWNYRIWNHTDKKLQVDPSRTALQHEEAIRLLTFLLQNLKGEAIQRFAATKQLGILEQQGAQVATFHIEVSLRGRVALELYETLEKLAGCSLLNLIGVSMKKDTLPCTPMARKLGDMVYRRQGDDDAAVPSILTGIRLQGGSNSRWESKGFSAEGLAIQPQAINRMDFRIRQIEQQMHQA